MKQTVKVKRRTDTRPLVGAGILTSTLLGVFLAPKPVLAACPSNITSAGTTITNRASVTYEDGTNDYTQESNEVAVQVAEIAGITVTAIGDVDINTSSRNLNDVVGFDFLVTNTGNDPTYFFLPGSANVGIVGGVIDTSVSSTGVRVVEHINNTTAAITTVNGDVATAGQVTSTALTGGAPIPDGGLIKPGDQIRVRVYVRITESRATFPVSVRYGNTGPNDNSSLTQNQFLANSPIGTPATAHPDRVFTVDEANPGPVSADGCPAADTLTPANGERQAAGFYEIRVSTQARPLALAKVLKTRTEHNPGADTTTLTDDTITYRLDLRVENTQINSLFTAAPLVGTTINLGGVAATRILVSDAIPVGTVIDPTFMDDLVTTAGAIPVGWTLVYTETALVNPAIPVPGGAVTTGAEWQIWNPAAPPTAADVTRIGFIHDGPLLQGATTTTDVNGLRFRVVTSLVNTLLQPVQIDNIAQTFGQTQGDNGVPTDTNGDGLPDTTLPVIIYDESGDDKPNNFSDNNTPRDNPNTPSIDGSYFNPTTDTGVADPLTQDIDRNNNNSGQDRDPSLGGGEANVFNLSLSPESPSGILNGPGGTNLTDPGNPGAVGPNSNNDDFYEKAGSPNTADLYDPVNFFNTVRNPATNSRDLSNVVLLPLTPAQAEVAAGHNGFGTIPPTDTVVVITYTPVAPYPAGPTQTAAYRFDGTNWVLIPNGSPFSNDGGTTNYESSNLFVEGITTASGVTIPTLIRDNGVGTFDVNYQVTIDPPNTAPIGSAISVPVVAYPENQTGSGFLRTSDSVFNIKIDRLFIGGFLDINKYVRLLDANGNVLQPYTNATSIPWNPQPGQILEYKIEYKNNGTRNLSGTGNVTLQATNLVIVEDGTLDWCAGTSPNLLNQDGNNWALNNTGTSLAEVSTGLDTSHVNGGANATRGLVRYFTTNCVAPTPTYSQLATERSGVTWATDVPVYRNQVGDLGPQETGEFTFRRRVN